MAGQRYDVMSVREYEQNGQPKSFWTKVGAAFTNRDGSIGVQLDCLPLDGKLVLQIPLTQEEKEARFNQRRQAERGGPRRQGSPQRGFQQRMAPPRQEERDPFDNEGEIDQGDIPE